MKKLLAYVLTIAISATAAIGGTVAYLQDSDSDVNVMTLGSVYIEQHEYERVVDADGTYEMVTSPKYGEGYKLQEFTQAKPLLPATGAITGWGKIVAFDQLGAGASGSQAVFAGLNNVQDKFVLVENTGKSEAYVRTLIALEMGDCEKDLIGISTGDFWDWNEVGIVNIDDNNYFVFEAVYKGSSSRHLGGILPAGEYTYNSLGQVYMKNEATNEDCMDLDGNENGTYDILVLSQAVQTAGFTDAVTALDEGFGDVTAEKVQEWFGGMVIPVYANNEEDVTKVIENGGKLYLESDVTSEEYNVGKEAVVEIELQDNTLDGKIINNGELTVSGGTVENDAAGIENYGVATFTDVTMNAGSTADYSNISHAGSETTYNNVDIDSAGGGIGAVDGAEVTFNSGSVAVNTASTSGRYNFYAVGEGTVITINDGEFSFSEKYNQKRAYIYAGSGAKVYVNGGTFGKASTRSGYTAGILGDGTVIITGGTFGFDPTTWVADGYEAVKGDGVWTVSAVTNP